jgi:hypothetical protein
VYRTSCTLSIVYSLWTVSWLIPYFKTCYYRECVNMCLPLSWKVLSHVFENRNLDSEKLKIGYSTLRSISTWNSIKYFYFSILYTIIPYSKLKCWVI